MLLSIASDSITTAGISIWQGNVVDESHDFFFIEIMGAMISEPNLGVGIACSSHFRVDDRSIRIASMGSLAPNRAT